MINQAKFIIALSTLLASSAAPAAQFLFNLHASATEGEILASPPTDWVSGTPVPSTVDISFVLDTLPASTVTYTYDNYFTDSQYYLVHFDAHGLAISNLSVQTDQGTLWSASNLSNGDIGGDNPSVNPPGGFFAGMGFSGAGKSLGWSFDTYPGISQSDLASSTDPLATLILGFSQPYTGSNLSLTGDWGTLYIDPVATVSAVPLPNTAALFTSGLFSFAWKMRRGEATKGRSLT